MQISKSLVLRILTSSLVVLIGMILFVGCSRSNTIDIKAYKIAPGNQAIIPILLDKAVRVDVRIDTTIENADDYSGTSITHEPGNIGIKIDDPSGNHVVEYMRIRAGDFMVLADVNGEYVITLDNSYSLSTTKKVTLKIRYS